MKITVISDTHLLQQYKIPLPGGDMLIHCGDGFNGGFQDELEDFLNWIRDLKKKYDHILYVPGNHDRLLDDGGGVTSKGVFPSYSFFGNPKASENLKEIRKLGVVVLIDEGALINEVMFYGTPWVQNLPRWGFNRGNNFREDAFKRIPLDFDVLITHAPPQGILDTGGASGAHIGDHILYKYVIKRKPKYHFFGHIHESYGHVESNGTKFYNCASLNREYNYQNKPVEVEI